MIREHEEIVTVLSHATDHAPDLPDGAVDAAQRLQRMPALWAEGMSRHVVIQEVDVDRGQAGVDVARHREGEELPDPHREGDVKA